MDTWDKPSIEPVRGLWACSATLARTPQIWFLRTEHPSHVTLLPTRTQESQDLMAFARSQLLELVELAGGARDRQVDTSEP